MDSCERCREAVSAALDGEQRPEDVFATAHHLRDCAACREFARRCRELDALVLRATDPDADAEPAGRPCCPGPARQRAVDVDCGCSPHCACGCRQGRACRCLRSVA